MKIFEHQSSLALMVMVLGSDTYVQAPIFTSLCFDGDENGSTTLMYLQTYLFTIKSVLRSGENNHKPRENEPPS